MNQGAMPAYPVSTADQHVGHQTGTNTWQFVGMTKREVFAMAAMQGMAMRVLGLLDSEVARAAVTLADATLAALATEPQQET